MIQIYFKEIHAFFSSLLGYVSILIFLLIIGIFLFLVPNTNILDDGYANLDKFFALAPWVIMFLIPAITMRSFSEEIKSGTIEILLTLPIKSNQLILGKFLAAFTLVFLSILPTLLYVFTINSLSVVKGNIDIGGIIGSYIGLLFLNAAFTAIGIFCSALTSNPVLAFLYALIGNFLLYSSFDIISQFPIFENGFDYIISHLGLQFHYKSISRGLIDTKDLIYFTSIVLLFLSATHILLEKRK